MYASACRLAAQLSIDRLQRRWPNLILLHVPIHASWLNQIEIFLSIQRKVLEPNDYKDLGVLARTLNRFERHWSAVAEPSSGTSLVTIWPS
jgi:hypothetical protein